MVLVVDPALETPARHGVQQLRVALEGRGWSVQEQNTLETAAGVPRIVLGTGQGNGPAATLQREAGVAQPAAPEALVVKKLSGLPGETWVLYGADARGLMYAALDAADRVGWAADATAPLSEFREITEQPAVRERALAIHAVHRATWESRFHDERYWIRYFDTLARQRFNRVTLVLGDEHSEFLALPYPYFLATPGLVVPKAQESTPAQQTQNLTALNRLIALAHERGLAVGLRLGSSRESSAPITTALKELLARAPGLDALQFRGGSTEASAELARGAQAQKPSIRMEPTEKSIASGMTRVLLWGDPDYARGYSGQAAWTIDEPLAGKMAGQPDDATPFTLMPKAYQHFDYEFERYWHTFQVWGRLGYNPATPPEVWQQEFRRRFGAAAPHIEIALHRASQVLPMVVAAYQPANLPARSWAERQSLGWNLADYSLNAASDPARHESFVEAANRIVAEGTTTKRTPDATALVLNETADAILAAASAAEASIGRQRSKEFDATLTDVRILAQLARFHARRAISAVHYNLFKRNLRLAELVAATLQEKEVVAAWRELVAIAGDRYSPNLAMGPSAANLTGHWRDELKKLEINLHELEEQCCPPDEAVLKEKVWQPVTAAVAASPHTH